MADIQDAAERAQDLAQNEDIEVLHSALYSALEADLSERGWPGDSKLILQVGFEAIEDLEKYINGKT